MTCTLISILVLLKDDHLMVSTGAQSDILYIYGPAIKSELKCKQLNYSPFSIFFFQCKHVLAIKLAEAMNLSKSQQVTDQEMTNLIKNLE